MDPLEVPQWIQHAATCAPPPQGSPWSLTNPRAANMCRNRLLLVPILPRHPLTSSAPRQECTLWERTPRPPRRNLVDSEYLFCQFILSCFFSCFVSQLKQPIWTPVTKEFLCQDIFLIGSFSRGSREGPLGQTVYPREPPVI